MKIVYISPIDLDVKGGSVEHILGLSSALARIGHEVHLVASSSLRNTNRLSGADLNLHLSHINPNAHFGLSGLSAAQAAVIVAKRALRIVAQVKPDIVYLRTFPMDYLLLSRHLIRAGIPYVNELNTVTDTEYRAAKGKAFRGRLYRFSEGRTLAHAAGWLPVTNEIYRYAERVSGVEKPFLIAKNGLNTERVVSRRPRALVRRDLGVADATPVLVMYSFEAPWHGADRAVSILANLKRPAELWLVGSLSAERRYALEQLAERKGVKPLVRIFPWMDQEDAAELVSAADVGLGTLALDRNRMTEAQPVKVASYLALGVPVLFNYEDPRLSTELPFARLARSNDPKVLAEHLDRLLDQPRNVRELARRFAVERLSWQAVALETAEFLQDLVSQRGDAAYGKGV